MADQTPANGIPAPYGRACTNCARAKCRCVYRAGLDQDCERCNRLKRKCTLPSPVRKWNGRQTNSSRISLLEEKLEDVITLLRDQASEKATRSNDLGLSGIGLNTPLPSSHPTVESYGVASPAGGAGGVESPRGTADKGEGAHGDRITSVPTAPTPTVPLLMAQISPISAEETFQAFRKQWAPYFPFIYLVPEMTSTRLRLERPFLWFVLMATATRSLNQQQIMGRAIKEHLAHELVIANKTSMDSLWGLLAFMAWSHYYRKEASQLTVYGSLAHSLVYDLSLHKTEPEPSHMSFFKNLAYAEDEPSTKEPSKESLRAVLACFFLTSEIATVKKRLEPMNWTPFLDDCLENLWRNPEWLGDKALVTLVRYQLVVEQITRQPWRFKGSGLPPSYLNTLRSRLQNIKREVPGELQSDVTLCCYYLNAELILNEASVKALGGMPNNPDFSRNLALDAVLDTIQRWFDIFLALTTSQHIGLTLGFWSQMGHFLISLSNLTIDQDSIWGREAVSSKLDLFSICDQLTQIAVKAAAERRQMSDDGSSDPEVDVFFKCRRIIQPLRNHWLAQVRAADSSNNNSSSSTAATGNIDLLGTSLIDGSTTDPLAVPPYHAQDAWLADLFQVTWS